MYRIIILGFSLFFCLFVYSFDLDGLNFSEVINIEGKNFVLNGAGMRIKKIAFVGIKVYAAGLYLENKEKNPEKILSENVSKCLLMHFVYSNVGKDKLKDAFLEGFQNNNPLLSEKLRSSVDRFLSFWDDMKSGDGAKLIYIKDQGTKVIIKNKEIGTIEGKDFSRLLFSVWLGDNPPNKELKEGLLGK